MNNPRDVAEDGQQNVEPEVQSNADLEEDTEWRQKDGEDNSDKVQGL